MKKKCITGNVITSRSFDLQMLIRLIAERREFIVDKMLNGDVKAYLFIDDIISIRSSFYFFFPFLSFQSKYSQGFCYRFIFNINQMRQMDCENKHLCIKVHKVDLHVHIIIYFVAFFQFLFFSQSSEQKMATIRSAMDASQVS